MMGRVFWLLGAVSVALIVVLGLMATPAMTRSTLPENEVVISEIAWGGTAAGVYFEWIELYNNSDQPVSVSSWTLSDGGDILITLIGTIKANDFYLLERDEDAVSDIAADQLYFGVLSDSGETLTLRDASLTVKDTANIDGDAWPAGEGLPKFLSMERLNPDDSDTAANWASNEGKIRNGLDADGDPINGTPRQPNSEWPRPDLSLTKTGPSDATAGTEIQYLLSLSNTGQLTADDVILSDTLPYGLNYLDDDSNLTMTQPTPGTLLWQVGNVPTGTIISFHLTATVANDLNGSITNLSYVRGPQAEIVLSNNRSQAVTSIKGPGEPKLLIDAVYYDGYESNEPDEAIRLINVGPTSANLSGWRISDNTSVATFPQGAILSPGSAIWVTKDSNSFARQFGFDPDYETSGGIPSIPDMMGVWPGFSNDGDEVILLNPKGYIEDVLVYGNGDTGQKGWSGPALKPYTVSGVFGQEGQILYRMRDQITGRPVPDTNTRSDWAQSRGDVIDGRRVRYPGWDLEAFFFPRRVSEKSKLTVGIAPDNAFELMVHEFESAQSSIYIEAHSFTSVALANVLRRVAGQGVEVILLMEGSPVSGIDDLERYVCRRLASAGGQCWFMISDENQRIFDRYRYLHAKFALIDGQRAIISTENFSPNSMPNDKKDDGTWGRRGVVLVTDAPGIVERLQSIWQTDFDPLNHSDLFQWRKDHDIYGDPPADMVPIIDTGGISYTVRYLMPSVYNGTYEYELVQSPENSLRSTGGLLDLLSKAGPGDTILVEQLVERPHWGPESSTALEDPNPRLESYLAAARRGATVRILLDGFFEQNPDGGLNKVTCDWFNSLASKENLDIECALANPTGLGIHNKMVLVEIDDRGYLFVGSLNGTELSHKGNREVVLLVQSDAAYSLLSDMFAHDWPSINYIPLIYDDYIAPTDHVVISEILYDPSPREEAEFVEIANPTDDTVNLSGYSLGDAVKKDDFEDVRRFPAGTILLPHKALVVALTASGFRSLFGNNPDFEILESDPAVPNLIDDSTWGHPAAVMQLGNEGDEVLLRNPSDNLIDAVAYGNGHVPNLLSCPLVALYNHSLERYPYWQDTEDCSFDFRDWPIPNPGYLP